jgi:hypothetical protein
MSKTMNTKKIAAYAVSLAALATLCATPAKAESFGEMEDRFRASWTYRNLDGREVMRYQQMGFRDGDIRRAANLAMKSGLELDYILRMHREAGCPVEKLAMKYGVEASDLDKEIYGYGMSPSQMTPMPSAMPTTPTTPVVPPPTTPTTPPATSTPIP